MKSKKSSIQIPVLTSIALGMAISTISVLLYAMIATPREPIVVPAPAPKVIVVERSVPRPDPVVHVRTAAVLFTSAPRATIYIDGAAAGRGPVNAVLPIGDHDVEFLDDDGRRYAYRVTVGPEDDAARTVTARLGSNHARTTGAVTAAFLGVERRISDERAALMFEDAIEHLRDRNNDQGCMLLAKIARNAPGESIWKSKAKKLSARRCDDE